MSKQEHPSDHHDSVFIEDAEVLSQQTAEAGQIILKLQAPRSASAAVPGMFLEISSDESNSSPNVAAIMRADAQRGWIEALYRSLSEHDPIRAMRRGQRLDVRVPIASTFNVNPHRQRALLIGYGMGIASIVFLAERLRERNECERALLVLLESDLPFPFRARPSTIVVDGMPEGTIACMPMLDEWGIPSRLASLQGDPGCYEGSVVDLATEWLNGLDSEVLSDVEIFASGPQAMLQAIAQITERFGVSSQLHGLDEATGGQRKTERTTLN